MDFCPAEAEAFEECGGLGAEGAVDFHRERAAGGQGACRGGLGLRPACYLDSDLLISFDEQDVTAEQAGDIVKELIESFGSSFATEEQLRAAASFMLGTLRATREQEAAHE